LASKDIEFSRITHNIGHYAVQGHSRSTIWYLLKAHMRLPNSDCLNTNLHTISHRFQVIADYWPNLCFQQKQSLSCRAKCKDHVRVWRTDGPLLTIALKMWADWLYRIKSNRIWHWIELLSFPANRPSLIRTIRNHIYHKHAVLTAELACRFAVGLCVSGRRWLPKFNNFFDPCPQKIQCESKSSPPYNFLQYFHLWWTCV